MIEKHWYYEIKGAAAFWLAGIVLALVGAAFVAVGVSEEEIFLFIGIPCVCLGILVLLLLTYGLYLKVKHPENYKTWLWWVNFTGGLAGALTFCIPSTLALPALLLLGEDGEALLIGAMFSVIGLVVTIAVGVLARRQYNKRPR
jgi:hypothetical protein